VLNKAEQREWNCSSSIFYLSHPVLTRKFALLIVHFIHCAMIFLFYLHLASLKRLKIRISRLWFSSSFSFDGLLLICSPSRLRTKQGNNMTMI
jgi:hypothetical protein